MEEEDRRPRARVIAWCFYLGCLLLLAASVFAPIYSWSGWRPAGENPGIWFQRSGAITTIFSLLSVTILTMGTNTLHKPGTWGDKQKLEVLDEFGLRFSIAEWSSLGLTITGTFIWGYGDLIHSYLGS